MGQSYIVARRMSAGRGAWVGTERASRLSLGTERASWLPAVAVSAALVVPLLAWGPHVRDLAAHVFREELFEREGFAIWNGSWYGGHYLLTHSVLFAPLAGLLGGRLVGAVSVVAGVYLFDRLVRERWGERAAPASIWYAVGAATLLASGRLSFALGVAFALAAMRALQRRHIALAAAASLGCALSSPVAAVFLAGILVVGAASRSVPDDSSASFARRVRVLIGVAAAALLTVLAINALFPTGGQEPFAFSAWVALPLWCGGALWVTRGLRAERDFRLAVMAYLVTGTLMWLVPNPLGGNATRLGALFGGPVLAAMLLSRRIRLAAPVVLLVLAGSAWWQLQGSVRDVAESVGDASTQASYYQPVQAWLARHDGRRTRIEVPFTFNHWETVYLARRFELARGWLRQVDRARNDLFYEGRLTDARYRDWLVGNAIRYVALPDAQLDYSAEAERRLIEADPAYLRLRARGAHWRIYEVRHARPLVEAADRGRARLVELGPDSFVLDVLEPGTFLVRVRGTPYWSVTRGRGCVGQVGPWTAVRADGRGALRVSTRFSLAHAARAVSGTEHAC
jgi:hypothetical protein